MVDEFEIEEKLRASFPVTHIEVKDTTGGGDHWDVVVSSPAFKGKSMIEQHRMVYAALGDAMKGPIHALSLRTSASE